MSATQPPRDPITQDKPGTAGGSMGHPSADRVKSLPSKGPNFTRDTGGKSGFPVPNSPYGKG
jgi:hypothetical protein